MNSVNAASVLIDAIRSGNLQLQLPQDLPLHDGQLLHCEQLLRLLPGKRGVFIARYRNQLVLAKVFLDSAARQVARERAGHERLIAAQQPTPKLIASVDFAGGSVLLFEFLTAAQPLFREDIAPSPSELKRLLDRLQSMYSLGVYHDDLHWGNFLLQRGIAFVIDAGAVRGNPPHALTKTQVVDNVGLLIAQFHRCDQTIIRNAVLTHALSKQFELAPDTVAMAAEKHWQRRKRTLLKKCFRDTTANRFVRTFDRVYAFQRACASPDLEAFLRDPDDTMARGKALKLGNSATVVKLDLDGRSVVIKRYNMKNVLHWLRRCWRPSRAWASWRNAHWLELLGLHTPAPIAFLEMRCGFLRRRAYYVCEFIEGNLLASELNKREPSVAEFAELEKYFTVAASERLVHGDLKATNFLLCNEKLAILDLDAMCEIKNHRRWKKLFSRDFSRFERNFIAMGRVWLDTLRQRIAQLLARNPRA